MSQITERRGLLRDRLIALEAANIGWEPHIDEIGVFADLPNRKLGLHADRIDWLARRYRRQIDPALVPASAGAA